MFGDFGGVVFVEEEDVDDDEGSADGDSGVGDVEGRPVVAAEPDFEEVGNRAVDDAISYVAGGAAGNVTDRIVHGAVTDFFEVWLGSYHWPAFNIADSAITIGAALIIIDVLFFHKHHTPEITKNRAG